MFSPPKNCIFFILDTKVPKSIIYKNLPKSLKASNWNKDKPASMQKM